MKIIRTEENYLDMVALLIEWGIKRCNVAGCKAQPNTIIAYEPGETGASPEGIMFGLCEEHFQQGNQEGGTSFDLEFDTFDAFAYRQGQGNSTEG